MRERNIFIGILIVALVGIGVVVYRTYYRDGDAYEPITTPQPVLTEIQQQPVPTPETATVPIAPVAMNTVVTYDANGFSPKPLTVKVGMTVMFTNKGVVDMWVASAPHPTHTDYPAFDAKRPVKPGDTYSFAFTRVGTWKYHNHLNPSQYGSVVVTE